MTSPRHHIPSAVASQVVQELRYGVLTVLQEQDLAYALDYQADPTAKAVALGHLAGAEAQIPGLVLLLVLGRLGVTTQAYTAIVRQARAQARAEHSTGGLAARIFGEAAIPCGPS